MEPKFNPGPWAYDMVNKTVLETSEGLIICTVKSPNALEHGNLIAASPELYEALKEEHKKIHSQVKCPDTCKICKILEKAEGFGQHMDSSKPTP
jgi:hypothetical protein